MIYKIEFEEDERIEYFTARNILHLLQSYANEFDFDLQNIVLIAEISEQKAKEIMIKNEDGELESLLSFVFDDDFNLIASDTFY